MYEVCIRGAVRCLDLDVRPGQIRGVREWRQHHREPRAHRQRAKVPSGNVGPALRKLVQIIVVTHAFGFQRYKWGERIPARRSGAHVAPTAARTASNEAAELSNPPPRGTP